MLQTHTKTGWLTVIQYTGTKLELCVLCVCCVCCVCVCTCLQVRVHTSVHILPLYGHFDSAMYVGTVLCTV